MSRSTSPLSRGSQPRRSPAAAGNALPPDAIREAWGAYARGERSAAESQCRAILACEAGHAGALVLLGILMAQARRTAEAAELLGRAAARLPNDASVHNNHGSALRELGQPEAALECYARALAVAPDFAEAHYNRAVALQELRRLEEALAAYDRAIELKPDYAAAYNNRGSLLQELDRAPEALASFGRAIELKPDHATAHSNRGAVLQRLGFHGRALASYDRALALAPDHAEAHNNRGAALQDLGRPEEALASFDRAFALKPDYAEAYNNKALALRKLGRIEESLASADRALSLDARCAEAHNNRGVALAAWRRFAEALASYDQALSLKPDYAEALLNRGAALYSLRRFEDALSSYRAAIALRPGDPDGHRCLGLALQGLNRPEEAAASLQRALALQPHGRLLRGMHRHARMHICDWSDLESDLALLANAVGRGKLALTPFEALSLFDSPSVQRRLASVWVREECGVAQTLPPLRRRPWHKKVRIGYFSADFRNHAVSLLAAQLFESHDRARFELTGFSLGPDAQDEMGARVAGAFERFIPAFDHTDEQIVALARDLQIDIAVDLGGYTQDARPRIFALRAAPIQVGYLGYLGTLGGKLLDYLIADEVLIPPAERRHYAEKIAYLSSYQVNDSGRPVPQQTLTRAQLGLPASGFVFCCFNASYKITPETFASWMRILSAVPASVLFLFGEGAVVRNLRKEALRRGVAPERLIFAGRVAYGEYLARYCVADLFLDTLPYNAGTTASDALWAGLPVLSCRGEAFASRMAASILTAAGVPELITADRAHYERRAIELASQPAELEALRSKLALARSRAPLFDTPRFTRELEALYERMYRRYHLGLLPEHLVPVGDSDLPPRPARADAADSHPGDRMAKEHVNGAAAGEVRVARPPPQVSAAALALPGHAPQPGRRPPETPAQQRAAHAAHDAPRPAQQPPISKPQAVPPSGTGAGNSSGLRGASRYDRELTLEADDPLARFAKRIFADAAVLDLGCGPGVLGRLTARVKSCTFDGFETDPEAVASARPYYRDIIGANLQNADLPALLPGRRYDFIVLADVLEHLEAPGEVLRRLPALLAPEGRVLISLPHLGYAGLVAELIAGRFEYRPWGLLDRTHLRFFTRASAQQMLELNGFGVVATDEIIKSPQDTEFGPAALDGLAPAVRAALLAGPDALVYQFLIEASTKGAPAMEGELSQALIQRNVAA
ncbi:MAG TPA: tetratricopeptide repeat protein [Steroidobacteraceae bacterium]|nr:tetratricopeptide repeat protein [Steroidobacteraceae bacterium]